MTAGHDRKKKTILFFTLFFIGAETPKPQGVINLIDVCIGDEKLNLLKNKTVILGAYSYKILSATRYTVLFSFSRNNRKNSTLNAKPNIM